MSVDFVNQIICGECEQVIKAIPDNSIDMIFTDPPYGHNNNNNGDLISRREAALGRGDYVPERDNRPIANDGKEAEELFKLLLPEFNRVMIPGGVCCCCCGGGGPDPMFARWSLYMDEIFNFKQMIVWDKGPMGMGWHYRRSYETVLVGVKRGAKVKWHDDSKRIENIIRHIGKIIPSKDQHPTQKPVELAEWFINLHSLPNEIILDPFCGSGSTLLAAIKTNRQFIGIDISQEYCELARKRINNLLNQQSLDFGNNVKYEMIEAVSHEC